MAGRPGYCCPGPYVTAYDIAVQRGFEGTEEEWLRSLSEKGVQDELVLSSSTPGSERLYSLRVDDAGALSAMFSASYRDISFLCYIDTEEEHLPEGTRRCIFGCDEEHRAYLPTTEGLLLPDGSRTARPAPWSFAVVAGRYVGPYVLCSDHEWREL